MQIARPLIHPVTERTIDAFIARPSHGILLSGPSGVGLGTVADYLAHQIDAGKANRLTMKPDDKGKISIESAHELISKLRFVRRNQSFVVVIDDADKLTRSAENALLKNFEEPVTGVYFILTSHKSDRVLPTIRSRLAAVDVRPLSSDVSRSLVKSFGDIDETKSKQLQFIGNGLPAELHRLAKDNEYFASRVELVTDAKTFLGGSLYERAQVIARYDKDRTRAIRLVDSLLDLLEFSVLSSKRIEQLSKVADTEATLDNLHLNGHVRTQLTALAAAWR